MTLVSINGSNFACHAEGMWICKLGLKGEHMNMLESDLAFGIGLSLFLKVQFRCKYRTFIAKKVLKAILEEIFLVGGSAMPSSITMRKSIQIPLGI